MASSRLQDVVRIKEEHIIQLSNMADSPMLGSLMAHPALIGFGASLADLLMLIQAISLPVRTTTEDGVVHFTSHIARRFIDCLIIGATALLQASGDKVLMFLHLVGAWMLQQDQQYNYGYLQICLPMVKSAVRQELYGGSSIQVSICHRHPQTAWCPHHG